MSIPNPPTEITVQAFEEAVKIEWPETDDTSVVGFNTYYSSTPDGGISGYIKANDSLITEELRLDDVVVDSQESRQHEEGQKTTTLVETVEKKKIYGFTITELPVNVRVYFRVTSVNEDNEESKFSNEVSAVPLIIEEDEIGINTRNSLDIVTSFIDTVFRRNALIDTKPGTSLRDLHIDPYGFEFEQAYIIIDFFSRAQNFASLRAVDDANNDGISDPLAESTYKQRLFVAGNFQSEDELQAFINNAFDRLAADFLVYRRGATASTGTVTFFSAERPTVDLVVTEGTIVSSTVDDEGNTQDFAVITDTTLEADNADLYFNPLTSFYELDVEVEATIPGEQGNVTAGSITIGGFGGFDITNKAALTNGQDQESNDSLSERGLNKQRALDLGSRPGYQNTVSEQANVLESVVIDAGSPFMMRDFDPLRMKHIFGKVDIYVRGERLQQYTETVSFEFKSVEGDEDITVLNSTSLLFQINNPEVDANAPVYEVTRVFNKTVGRGYSVDNVIFPDVGDQFQLDPNNSLNRVFPTSESDIIEVDYSYRGSDPIVPSRQPVRRVASVTSNVSGELEQDINWIFIADDDPLRHGNSVEANRRIQVIYANGKPTGGATPFSEDVVLAGFDEEKLSKRGIATESIIVQSQLGFFYAEGRDYVLSIDDILKVVSIRRSVNSNIADGEKVKVSYEFGEELTIVYETNSLVQDLQDIIDDKDAGRRHIDADVLVKEAIPVLVDTAFTVKLREKVAPIRVKTELSTSISNEIERKEMGGALNRSDVIRISDENSGVDRVALPLSLLVRSSGGIIVNELIEKQFVRKGDGNINRWSATNALRFNTLGSNAFSFTLAGQNITTRFFGINQDDFPLVRRVTEEEVATNPGSFLITSTGEVIVSTIGGDDANDHVFHATYITSGEGGDNDIQAIDLEFLKTNDIVIETT